jgi:hypothetical protein
MLGMLLEVRGQLEREHELWKELCSFMINFYVR